MGKNDTDPFQGYLIHKVLAHSYSVYFLFFLAGVYLDLVFRLDIFHSPLVVYLGWILLFLATLLIFWAQKTSRNLSKENLSKENFMQGPYRYTRGPTHLGLFFLILGFGMTSNAFFIVLFSPIAFLITKFFYLRREEKILENKYGAPYLEYKKAVKF